MSEDPRGELIKGARPNPGEIRSKRGKATSASIPVPDHTDRDGIVRRLKERKSK